MATSSSSLGLRLRSAAVLLLCVVIATRLSLVEQRYYGSKSPTVIIYKPQLHAAGLNSTQVCLAYGGSCVIGAGCSTIHLYRQYRHSIISCNSTAICCLPVTNFYTLYGHVKTIHILHHRRRRRRRRYKKPWRRRGYW